MHGRQQRIDWVRGQQLTALRGLVVPRKVQCADGSSVSAAKIKAVLFVIDSHAGKSGECWANARTIAEEANVSLRTVRRALEAATQIKLLVRAQSRNSHGHPRVAYRICWPNVIPEETPPVESEASPVEPDHLSDPASPVEPSAMVTKPSAMVTKPSAMVTKPSAMVAPPSETSLETQLETPPPPSPGPVQMEEEVLELLELGIKFPTRALQRARQWHSPATIRSLIEHFRQHREEHGWGPGALMSRFSSPQPRCADGWPPPDPTAVARARQRREAALEADRDARRQQAVGVSESEMTHLEAAFGDAVDGLADQQRVELLERSTPVIQELYRRNPDSPRVRRALLRLIAADRNLVQIE